MPDININLGIFAVAAGTPDVITAAYTPTTLALYNGLYKQFRASGANTIVAPTLNVDTLGAKPIVKKGGNALVAGDIAGAGHVCEVSYNSTSEKWELLNPASDASDLIWEENAGAVTLQDVADTVILGGNTNSAGFAPFGIYTEAGLIALVIGDLGADFMYIAHDAVEGFVFASGIDITFQSTVKALTQSAGDNSTKVATTAYADRKTDKLITTNRQTASYTLALTDADKLVEMNVGSANNLTVPANATVAFPIGTQILIAQYGAGQTTLVAAGSVNIRSSGTKLKLSAQYAMATLIKIGTNEWYLSGDLTT